MPVTIALGAVLFLRPICSGCVYTLWYEALEEHGPTITGAALYFEPFFTVLVAGWLLNEPVSTRVFGGGLLVLSGVWFLSDGVARSATT